MTANISQQVYSPIYFCIRAALHSQNCASLNLTALLFYCVTYDVMFWRMQACTSQFLLFILYRLCLTLTTKTSIHSSHSTDSNTQSYSIYTMQCTAQRHRRTKQATVCIVTARHSTDAHTHDSNDCYSLQVLLLRFCSETGEFWTTLKLHCAMRISGIAVVSSIAIPETVSLSSLQFQVSHNTTMYHNVSV